MTEVALAVRRELAADAAAVRAVHEAAYGRSAEADLVDALRDSAAVQSWVAAVDRRVVAHAMLSRVQVGGDPALILAPVGVLPDRQGHGHGSAVVRAALSAATADGERLVVVLGDPGWYARFGFEPAARHGVANPFDAPDADFQVLLIGGSPPTGEVTYPAAFDALP